MNTWYDRASRLDIGKQVVREMAATVPAGVKKSPDIRLFGSEYVAGSESTWLVTGIDNVGSRGLGRTPMARAITAAGDDVKGLSGKTAIILVSDFEHIQGASGEIDDLNPKNVLEAVAKLKANYGNKVCIYPIQVEKDVEAKKLADQIVADGGCGFVENADNLQTPAQMGAYVQKVFFCPPPAGAAEKPAVVPPPPPPPPLVVLVNFFLVVLVSFLAEVVSFIGCLGCSGWIAKAAETFSMLLKLSKPISSGVISYLSCTELVR